MFDSYVFWAFIVIIERALAVGVTIHAVLYKRDTRAVIGWVGLTWLTPFIGAIGYVCFGINRIQRKASNLKLHDRWDAALPPEYTAAELEQIETFSEAHPSLVGLATAGKFLTGHNLLPGNTITPLIDGDEAYPQMLAAIDSANKSVSLLSYIFDSDQAGDSFLQALIDAQARGVRVRVLIDDIGSKYSRPNMVDRLKHAGLPVASFLPARLPRLPKYANMRNHRKVLVADGIVGFTGGTNIRDGHVLKSNPAFPVQCLHFKIEGPVVAHLQQAFAKDWAFTTDESISGDDWFPVIKRNGEMWARGIEHGPDENFEVMTDTITAALASARENIRIVTPYFLPNDSLIRALNVASMRGVNLEIYLPSRNNIALVQWAATAQLWQMLEKGCNIYYTDQPFDHTKLMVVDGVWALIGSTNWDARSLRLNFEFNLECYNLKLATELNSIIDDKAKSARPVTLDEVNERSFPVKLRDGLARLLSPYL